MKATDDELMILFRAGNHEAFTKLYERYRNRIYRFILSNVRISADAEEIVQDVFLRITRYGRNYQPRGKFSQWIFQITANSIKSRWQNLYHTQELQQIEDFSHIEQAGISAEKRFETRQLLERLFQELNPNQRIIILLKEMEGFTSAEISEMLDISNENVRIQLYRARQKMTRTWEKNCHDNQ